VSPPLSSSRFVLTSPYHDFPNELQDPRLHGRVYCPRLALADLREISTIGFFSEVGLVPFNLPVQLSLVSSFFTFSQAASSNSADRPNEKWRYTFSRFPPLSLFLTALARVTVMDPNKWETFAAARLVGDHLFVTGFVYWKYFPRVQRVGLYFAFR